MVMKKDIGTTKRFLEEAIKNLPENRNSPAISVHIQRALNEIAKIEKDSKRKLAKQSEITPRQKWELDLESGMLKNPFDLQKQKDILNQIDQMLEVEKAKLEEMQSKKTSNNQTNDILID